MSWAMQTSRHLALPQCQWTLHWPPAPVLPWQGSRRTGQVQQSESNVQQQLEDFVPLTHTDTLEPSTTKHRCGHHHSNSCTQTKYQKLKIKIVVFRQLQPGPVLSRVRSSLPRGPGQVLSGVWSQEARHLNQEERGREGRGEETWNMWWTQLTFVVITQ